jgi:hypothetical protein
MDPAIHLQDAFGEVLQHLQPVLLRRAGEDGAVKEDGRVDDGHAKGQRAGHFLACHSDTKCVKNGIKFG